MRGGNGTHVGPVLPERAPWRRVWLDDRRRTLLTLLNQGETT